MTILDQAPADSPPAVKTRKKLIEVALPLEKINIASAREKSIRHGHPSTLHLWWARRPLAAARAVIFSQMVDDSSEYSDELLADPSTRQHAERELASRRALWLERTANQKEAAAVGDIERADPGPEPTLEGTAADLERERLFRLIEQLVEWENTINEPLLEQARAEIRRSWRRTCADNKDHPRAAELFNPDLLPAFHDPFAGGGALPLEAQRLGLEAYASDLNPVAVLINKAMIEIPPKFAGKPPVNPEARSRTGHTGTWHGAQGLAEDVRFYVQWMRDEAERRIGHLYPKIEITTEMARHRPDLKPYVGRSLTVIAWLWARTVKSPNPAFANVDVPLASTFMLSTKPGKEAYVEPVIEAGAYRFTVKVGKPKSAPATNAGTTAGKRAAFRCLISGVPVTYDHIRAEGRAGRMGARLMAVVAEGDRGRVYLPPTSAHEAVAVEAKPEWKPDTRLEGKTRVNVSNYGFDTFGDLFTPRQLVALTTFCDLVQEARERVRRDAVTGGLPDHGTPLRDGGTGTTAYAEAVGMYLACGISRSADFWSNLCIWANQPKNELVAHLFGRQAIPMAWDYAEANPFSESGGNFQKNVSYVAKSIDYFAGAAPGHAAQFDAAKNTLSQDKLISTDPPYYDNIGYADLSDYFYVWLRRSLRPLFPELFATLAVPKAEELVATPYRHGSKDKAEAFFLGGMTEAMHRLAEQSHPAFPLTIFYAFKQSETETDAGTASTGWETFLDAVIRSGLAVSGTWPMRTERTQGLKGLINALASSIILVCRPRAADAPTATRREFVSALVAELPQALAHLQRGNIAPVDLAQAAIGPGMAVYTRYAKVVDAEDRPLTMREALALINQTLDEALAEQEGDFDADSRWALTWYEQHGFTGGRFGMADDLARARNTSVEGMKEAGILASGGGIVRLLLPNELNSAWDPATDRRRPAWQAVHQLIQAAERGESAFAGLIAKIGPEAEIARELAYRLYVLSERKKRTQEALWYNGLVQSWPEAVRLARTVGSGAPEQQQLFDAG